MVGMTSLPSHGCMSECKYFEAESSYFDIKVILNVNTFIPVPVIKPLSYQFYGRLSPVHFSCRHIQIINKNDLYKNNTKAFRYVLIITLS